MKLQPANHSRRRSQTVGKRDLRRALVPGRSTAMLVLLLAAVTILVYSGSFAGQFTLDDQSSIVRNDSIQSLTAIKPWENFRSLVEYSFAVNYWWGRLDPWAYHLVNLTIHLLTGLTLFGLVRRTLLCARLAPRYADTAGPLAFSIALIWLVHPLCTQAVTYVVQRFESTAALWYVLAMYAFCRGADDQARGKSPAWWWTLVVACFALGLRSKETIITLPLILLAYDRVFVADSWRDMGRRRFLYAGLCLVAAVLAGQEVFHDGTLVAQQLAGEAVPTQEGPVVHVAGLTPQAYALSQPGVIWHYLWLAVCPCGQCLDYGWPIATTPAEIAPPLLGLAPLLALIAWAAVRHPPIGFLGIAFFVFLAPTSSLLPIRDLAVEHRMYLPLVSVITLVVLSVDRFLRACQHRQDISVALRGWLPALGPILVCAAVVALGIGTMARNSLYASPVALWTDTCAKSPHFWRAHHVLGKALYEAGDLSAALEQESIALELEPGMADVWATRGNLWVKAGRFDQALNDFNRAIALEPQNATYYYNRAMAEEDTGQWEQALADCKSATAINPAYQRAYAALDRLKQHVLEQAQAETATHAAVENDQTLRAGGTN